MKAIIDRSKLNFKTISFFDRSSIAIIFTRGTYMNKLRTRLQSLHRKSYGAYKEIKGRFQFEDFELSIDYVQGDPFAIPTRISVQVDIKNSGFCTNFWSNNDRKIAFEDYLARSIKSACKKIAKGNRGSGKSGFMSIYTNHQQVLQRNSVLILDNKIEARLFIGLPADGRRILANEAESMFFDELPKIIRSALYFDSKYEIDIKKHIESVEDQAFLRRWLKEENLVAFVANKSILPRKSGINDAPMDSNVVLFQTPDSLLRSVELPNSGLCEGMGLPVGVTLIVGGGFHGKSTLLNALEKGVYNHIPEDGREKLVTDESAVKIRAEDGRAIFDVDISDFIDHLPLNKNTQHFDTENASGSTSQAANIVEAVQCGANLLLIDEDTSASNFMIRDDRMQALVSSDKEPITPLIHRVRALYEEKNISTILVMGGSGDYFGISDTVIMMDNYETIDVTKKAHQLAGDLEISANPSVLKLNLQTERKPKPKMISARRGKHEVKFDVKSLSDIHYGEHQIQMDRVEQLVDLGQSRAIAWIINYYEKQFYKSSQGLMIGIDEVLTIIERLGLDSVTDYKIGNLARPRKYEIMAAINRIRKNH